MQWAFQASVCSLCACAAQESDLESRRRELARAQQEVRDTGARLAAAEAALADSRKKEAEAVGAADALKAKVGWAPCWVMWLLKQSVWNHWLRLLHG